MARRGVDVNVQLCKLETHHAKVQKCKYCVELEPGMHGLHGFCGKGDQTAPFGSGFGFFPEKAEKADEIKRERREKKEYECVKQLTNRLSFKQGRTTKSKKSKTSKKGVLCSTDARN